MLCRTLALLLVLSVALAQEPEPAPAGLWKVLLPVPGEPAHASWIVRFEKKGDAWAGAVVAAAEGVHRGTVEAVRRDGQNLRFTLKLPTFALPIQVKLPTEKEPRLLGEATVQGQAVPVVLEPTKLTALDDFALAQEVLSRPENTRATFKAAVTLLALAGERKAKPDDVKTWAARGARAAAALGAEQRDALLTLAAYLTEIDGAAPLAVDYATRAEALLTPADPPIAHKRILRVLARALDRSGKTEEARAVRARDDKLELVRLRPFTGKSTGVVLVETFTCAQERACVAPEVACDALAKTYPADAVLVLNHHVSLPGPDPLANPTTEERERYYRPRTTPVLYFNGKPGPAGGGTLDEAQARYDAYVAALNPLVERVANRPTLTIKPVLKGDTVEVAASVRDLATPGEQMRLRLVLVEEVVEYTGANGLPRHTNVVRDYLGGTAGLAVPEKVYARTVSVNVAELRRRLRDFLERAHQATAFPSKVWPLELTKLRVVAFLQDDRTREVLAAVAAEVKVPK